MREPTTNETPPYVAAFRKKFKRISRFAIERSILRHWKREYSQGLSKSPYGHTWSHHFCEYTKLATPEIEITPWFVRMADAFEKTCLIDGKKIINFIGSRSSGKTDFNATFAINMMSIWPEMTTIYVAAPFIKAANSTVWARCKTRFKQIKKAQPEKMGHIYENKALSRLVFADGSQSGFIELVTIDDVGKLQGIKSVHPTDGWLFLFCDEVALFKKKELLEVFGNITENSNFCCFTGCNFRDRNGLEGDLCYPDGREYDDLDPEADQDWPSNYKSHTWRFDGHLSPNILAGRNIYPYLLKVEGRQEMEDIHGIDGPKYMEQIRSFPVGSAVEFYVTTRGKVLASGAFDDCVFTKERPDRVGFCDPGFGGDPCKIGGFDYGSALIPTLDGSFVSRPVFQPIGPLETIKIETRKICDKDWIRRIRAVTDRPIRAELGKILTPEQQIAVKSAEYCKRHSIPYSKFGFDGSMRASIVTEFYVVMDSAVHAIDFGGMGTERLADMTGEHTAQDLYSNYVTEIYFAFGDLVQAGQFRGAQHVQAGINQICKRWWEYSGVKKKIQSKHGKSRDEDKKSYVAQNGRSPDDGDTLCGGLEMARRNGFRGDMTRDGSARPGGGVSRGVSALLNSDKLKRKTGAKLGKRPTFRVNNPTGRHGVMRH